MAQKRGFAGLRNYEIADGVFIDRVGYRLTRNGGETCTAIGIMSPYPDLGFGKDFLATAKDSLAFSKDFLGIAKDFLGISKDFFGGFVGFQQVTREKRNFSFRPNFWVRRGGGSGIWFLTFGR